LIYTTYVLKQLVVLKLQHVTVILLLIYSDQITNSSYAY